MIDLDVRLDSSLTDEDYGYLSRLQHLENKQLTPLVMGENNKADYIVAREYALELLQTEDAIRFAMNSLVHRLARQGYLYVEIGITPYLHKKSGLTDRRIINAALRGMYDGLKLCENIDANLIVYCHRQAPNRENIATVDLATSYKEDKVVAIGLEGDDSRPVMAYQTIFRHARKNGYPVVVEIGGTYNSNASIIKAVELGAKRIISPYKLELTNELISYFNAKNVSFIFRPIHDVINEYYAKIEDLPLKSLWSYGFKGFIAGGSLGICNSSAFNNYYELLTRGMINKTEIQRSIYLANLASFASEHEKSKFTRKSVRDFEEYYSKLIN